MLVLLTLFFKPLFGPEPLYSPDSTPLFRDDHRGIARDAFTGVWEQDLVGQSHSLHAFTPAAFLGTVLPPLVYHHSSYILSVIFLGFACAFYLRGHGVRGFPLWAAGMAMAGSGYTFTLISAGHRGIFEMTPWMMMLFACIDRAILHNRTIYYAFAGACVAFGLAAQPDLTALFVLAAAGYAILLAIGQIREAGAKGKEITRLGLGALTTGLVFLLLALGSIQKTYDKTLPERQQQQGRDQEAKWIFATNWSMPPEEILEMVVAGVYGQESTVGVLTSEGMKLRESKRPYWGRVGRSIDWEPVDPEMPRAQFGFANYKQHTIYLGLLPLLLASYGLCRIRAWDSALVRRIHWFWLGLWVLGLFLALGRYFPLYRVFYALPYFGNIRAPIKFVHWMEFSTAILCGFGLSAMLRDLTEKRTRSLERFVFASAGFGGVLLLAGLIMLTSSLDDTWRQVLPSITTLQEAALRTGILTSFLFAFFLTAGIAAFVWLSSRKKISSTVLAAFVLVAIGIDLIRVNRPYVHTQDLSWFYADNSLATDLANEPPTRRVYNDAFPTDYRHPHAAGFWRADVDFLNPGPHVRIDERYEKYMSAMGSNFARLMQLTATDSVITSRNRLQAYLRSGYALEKSFGYGTDGAMIEVAPERSPYFLLRTDTSLPRAIVYHDWATLPEVDILSQLKSSVWDPTRNVIIDEQTVPKSKSSVAPEQASTSPAKVLVHERNRVVIETDLERPGILLLNDKWDEGWTVRIGKKSSPLLRANYLMRAVEVPAGKHQIVFSYRPAAKVFLLSVWTSIALIFIGAWTGMGRRIQSRSKASEKGSAAARQMRRV